MSLFLFLLPLNIKLFQKASFLEKTNKPRLISLICWVGFMIFFGCSNKRESTIPIKASFEEALDSRKDLWGEEAMNEPNGSSYKFFSALLPPPKYVNADFRYYPIVLSAPNSSVKARLISDGSGVNLRGGAHSWRDVGTPVLFRVGLDEFLFGSYQDRLTEPVLAEGWLPIPQISYSHRTPVKSEGDVPLNVDEHHSISEVYRLEAFASTDSSLAEKGVVFVKFDLQQGNDGYISVEVDANSTLKYHQGRLLGQSGSVLAMFDEQWELDGKLMKAHLQPGKQATLAIPTNPLDWGSLKMTSNTYDLQREMCIKTWKSIIDKGMHISIPEPLVDNMYKNSLCQIFQLINGDEVRYSSGNQYDKMYEGEGSEVSVTLLNYGYEKEMRRLMLPLFNFTRVGLELHHVGFKLNNLIQYYWQTRDEHVVNELRPYWEKEIKILESRRTGPNGLYPEEQYCGDIDTYVQSLNVNAKSWRAMRDFGVLLEQTGNQKEAEYYIKEAKAFRNVVLKAVNKVTVNSTVPPFIPIALNGDEPLHDPILHSRIGSYWNITIGYTISSGVFPPGSIEENWIPHYQEQHGGLFMGMLRSGGGGQFNFWIGDQRINPLYGNRYTLDVLRRDEPERALVSFYGMLAQGMTRNTFVGGEASSLEPVDDEGRTFYCPPNSSASAHALSMLRNMLVQDSDLDDDGIPETLRLGFATSRRWLEDGKTIKVEDAPTAFGQISYSISSNLNEGTVILDYTPPPRRPQNAFIRVRVPDKWIVESGYRDGQNVRVDPQGTIEVSSVTHPVTFHLKVKKN